MTQRNSNNEESLLIKCLRVVTWNIEPMKGWYDSQNNHRPTWTVWGIPFQRLHKRVVSSYVTGQNEDSSKHKFLHFTHITYTEIQNYKTWKIKLSCFLPPFKNVLKNKYKTRISYCPNTEIVKKHTKFDSVGHQIICLIHDLARPFVWYSGYCV